ncbi:MAG: hypothetical protein RL662_1591 [Bacteroidota bacterium]|jgi:L-alanine-DL-glutamate epimerase-like enolase superfamily enzyme
MTKLNLSYRPYDLQLKYPFATSNYRRTSTPIVLIELEYDGIVGYGEASLPQYLGETQSSVSSFLNKLNLAQFSDPTDIESILEYVDCLQIGNTAAKASVDIALHDLVGKMKGKSWCDIWGLDREQAPYTTYTIGIDCEDIVKQKTKEVASDFKILKVKLGGENDRNIIKAIRSVTNLPLAIDANQGWSDKREALDMIFWLKNEGSILIEQPLQKTDLEGNAWLTQHSPLPIFADESIQRLVDMDRIKGAFSGINIKLMKCTGMHEARKMIELAPTFGFDVMLGCMTETSCAISAASQLSPAVSFADLDGALLITNEPFRGTTVCNGKITLNTLSGIGAELIL